MTKIYSKLLLTLSAVSLLGCSQNITATDVVTKAKTSTTTTSNIMGTDMLPDPYLGFFKLIVTDMDKMEKFYTETFGFKRQDIIDFVTFEERVLRLPDGKTSLVLYKHKDGREITIGNGHGPVGIVTKNEDNLHEAALEAGASEKMAPRNFGPVYLSFLFDPEGHEVELIHQPTESTTTMESDMRELENRWNERIESGKAYTSDEMRPDFLKLEPISIGEIIGMWHGGKFDAGTTPDPINWYGKKFISEDYVEPLMIKAPDGSIIPFEKLGSARLRNVEYGGKASATIIYNNQPIMDYFRKVNDNTIIGWGEVKGDTPDFFFWLKRESK